MPPVDFWQGVAPPVLKSSPLAQVWTFAIQKCIHVESAPNTITHLPLLLDCATRPEKTLTEALSSMHKKIIIPVLSTKQQSFQLCTFWFRLKIPGVHFNK